MTAVASLVKGKPLRGPVRRLSHERAATQAKLFDRQIRSPYGGRVVTPERTGCPNRLSSI
jgi:hypothetical protein